MKADVGHIGGSSASGSADRGPTRDSDSGRSILGSRLFIKYVALFVSVVVLALVANGAFEVWFSFQEQKAALTNLQHQQAEAAADKIEEFVTQIQSQLGWTTQLPWTNGTLDQRRFDALRLLRQVPAITELAQIDASGHEQLRVSRLTMDVVGSGIDYSDKPEFKGAVKNKVYYGPVYFRRESEPYMTIALAGARVENGVSVAQVNLKLIWDVVSGIKVGENGHAYVVDGDGRLIAHPDISLVLRNTDMSKFAQVQAARAGGSGQDVQEADDLAGHKVLTAYARVHPLGWYVFVETPIEEAYAPLYRSIQRSGYVLFGALLLAFIAGAFLARRMVVPIQALRAGAARIGAGDLGQRIDIKTGDEVEALANQFNDMAGQLQESYADLEKKVDDRTRELTESLEQQTATSEVLRVISSSPGELDPVFHAMLENATRICQAKFGVVSLREGTALRVVAMNNPPPAYAELRRREPTWVPTGEMGRIAAQAVATKKAVQVPDLAIYNNEDALIRDFAATTGARSLILVPLLKEGEVIGTSAIYRQEVRPFTDKQVELLTNFAAQAVIAIENARLLGELRESLAQQTATSDVLRVISSSPGDLKPVFESILDNATRICQAEFGTIYRYDGMRFHMEASHGEPPELLAFRKKRGAFRPPPGQPMDRMLRTNAVVHSVDNAAEPVISPAAQLGGARSHLAVPMFKEGTLVGAITIYRTEVRPFADKQIELVRSFAAQAVIAVENTRLLSELRESLDQQTATADVLRVISSSPGELDPVFQAMLDNATRLCDAPFGILLLRGEGLLRIVSGHVPPDVSTKVFEPGSELIFTDNANHPLVRMVETKEIMHIADLTNDPAYIAGNRRVVAFADDLGGRATLCVPMLKDNECVGGFVIFRRELHPFTEKQIALVQNFAAQAVIAIENARLLSELRESLEQQTATADVLRVISASPGDLQPVFDSILENATRICEAQFGALVGYDGDVFHDEAIRGAAPPAFLELFAQRNSFQPPPGTVLFRLRESGKVTHDADASVTSPMSPPVRLAGAKSMLAVPMFKDEMLAGAIVIYRTEIRPFTDKQIALVENFAAQAVIAIENARLLNELRQRTADLSKSLEDLRTAQDRLVQSQKLASLGQLTAGIAHEIKNPLNFVNNFSALSVELVDELNESLGEVQIDDKLRDDIAELSATLRGNMEKIVQHGKRADSIVKNMLLHSREGSGEHRAVEINAIVEEALNLAYHGARAEKQGFNITLERAFDPAAGQVDIYPQEVTRVLLNLITNGFYAAAKRKGDNGGDGGYEPVLSTATKNLGDRVEIRIRDNGTGIPPEVKEKMFNPFFTTKPAGEGTGLGLSISHDIIVKQHSGTIEVDTRPGEFTEFRIVLPRAAAFPVPAGGKA